MTKKLISRKTSEGFQAPTSLFAPRPFATPRPPVAKGEGNNSTAPIRRKFQNSNLLSRVTVTPPESLTPTLKSANSVQRMGEDISEQGKSNRVVQNKTGRETVPVTPVARPLTTRYPIQAKLTIGEAGDQYEQEADRVAREVVNRIHAPITASSSESNSVQRQISTQASNRTIQRVCGVDESCSEEPNASYPELNYTPGPLEANASYPEATVLPAMSAPSSTSSPTPARLDSPEATGWELLNNPVWNAVTHNAISGTTGLLENVNPAGVNLPTLRNGLIGLGGTRGWDAALRVEDALSLPASRLPGVFGQSESIVGSRLPGGMSRASAVLAPLGVISNGMGVYDAIARPDDAPRSSGLERGGDVLSNSAGFFSSAVGTTALAGAGLQTAGATALGVKLSAGAAALGPAAAVAGAGAGGYAAGQLLDEGVGGLMNWTGASAQMDRRRGITRPVGESGDYTISGMGANAAVDLDQTITSGMRHIGAYDESQPAYTQTLGWKLAEYLPSWLQ